MYEIITHSKMTENIRFVDDKSGDWTIIGIFRIQNYLVQFLILHKKSTEIVFDETCSDPQIAKKKKKKE